MDSKAPPILCKHCPCFSTTVLCPERVAVPDGGGNGCSEGLHKAPAPPLLYSQPEEPESEPHQGVSNSGPGDSQPRLGGKVHPRVSRYMVLVGPVPVRRGHCCECCEMEPKSRLGLGDRLGMHWLG